MLPVMQVAPDNAEHKFSETVQSLAVKFNLSDDKLTELLPRGTQAVFSNRVGWAKSYLKQAGMLTTPKRGYFRITDKGQALLASNPAEINVALLVNVG